jgi:N-acetylmuramoyl-L-alanine amidase
MRRVLLLGTFLVWAPAAPAAPLAVSAQATPAIGQAPLEVTLAATGEAESFIWNLGDGTQAEGRVVRHVYTTGRFTATVTAGAGGETTQASVTITAFTLSLKAPRTGIYGRRLLMSGRLVPALARARVSLFSGEQVVAAATTNRSGRVRFRPRLGLAATYQARFGTIASNAVSPAVRPALDTALPRTRMIGQRLALRARVRPVGAGTITARVWRPGRAPLTYRLGKSGVVRMPSRPAGAYVVRVSVAPAPGFIGTGRMLRTTVHVPFLWLGSRGPSVRVLERRLAELAYAVRGIDGLYSYDTYDAVLAFQKVNGLARTGRVDPYVWKRLGSAHRPRPRYPRGSHIEVDKRRQVLFEVRSGRVVRVVHVSTGATGNTPVGRWRVYRKVVGWDWVLWYPMYFLRGFAIHGYPSVPVYPASHGCVRVPMWVAPRLFSRNSYGETIFVY